MSKKSTEQIISNIDDKYICETNDYIKKRNKISYKLIRRLGNVAACFGIIFVLSISSLSIATAAGVMPAYDILYSLYPEVALKLSPVNISCEDNGIKMEVESVYVHDDTAEIYISMQDLTSDRIDETTDLFDSYDIHTPRDSVGTCSLIDYDENSKTATFLVYVQQQNNEKIQGGKMTFSVSEFLSGKEQVEKELSEISLENVTAPSEIQTQVDIRGWSGRDQDDNFINSISGYLLPNEEQSVSPVTGAAITALGFIDNKLHIQVHYEDILNTDNHGYIYLKDSSGNPIECRVNTAFWDEDKTSSYEEYIFDIGENDDLSELSVWGYFVSCKPATTGNWEVTFPIENRE